MKKYVKLTSFLLCIVMVMGIFSATKSTTTYAENIETAHCYNGNWTYFTIGSTVYKMNSETGKTQKVKTIKNAFNTYNVTYFDGYLYFVANYFLGSGGEDQFICKMKADGTGFKKLTRGRSIKIYNDRIFFIKVKHDKQFDTDTPVGIASMTTKGKKVKTEFKLGDNCNIWNYDIYGGNIYYLQIDYNDSDYTFYAHNIETKEETLVESCNTNAGPVTFAGVDENYLYYQNGVAFVQYDLIEGTKKTHDNEDFECFAPHSGKVFFSDYNTRCLKEYDFNTNTEKTIKKKVYITHAILGNGTYHIFENQLTQKEYEKSGYTTERARMKLNGKGYKSLFRYYVS